MCRRQAELEFILEAQQNAAKRKEDEAARQQRMREQQEQLQFEMAGMTRPAS